MCMSNHSFFSLFSFLPSKPDVRLLLGLVALVVVIVVLAYLTNPSESSFRTYLTEQSFRHHLTHLDRFDDDFVHPDACTSSISSLTLDNPLLLHFASRASVSLRTPKHVFHSFGMFTVATISPMAKASQRTDHNLSSIITDSWYIGAFGKWWRGGSIEAWYQDIVARSKDEECRNSGILSLCNLDFHHEYSGLPVPSSLSPTYRSTAPKLRNRERSSQRTNGPPPRSNTPPPLPMTASLPLHASRPKHAKCRTWPSALQTPTLSALSKSGPPIEQTNGIADTLQDLPPRITELLRQIAQAQATVLDLHAQLSECKCVTSQPRVLLQEKVDAHRERRRLEDAVKVELKSRTKSLDESRRQAESLKREVEKKLKTAQSARTSAKGCLSLLDKKISQLQQQLADDQSFVNQQPAQLSASVLSLAEDLEFKKGEIKATEAQISSLSQHARELEGKLSQARGRLDHLRNRAEIRRMDTQQLIDDRHLRSRSDLSTPLMDETAKSKFSMGNPDLGLATFAELGCSPPFLHNTRHVSSSSGQNGIMALESTSTSDSASYSPSPILPTGSHNATASYPIGYKDHRGKAVDSTGDHSCDLKIPTLGSGWGHSQNLQYISTESGGVSQHPHDWLYFGSNEKGLKYNTHESCQGPRIVPQVAGHPEATSLYEALDPYGFHVSEVTPATTSNPSLLRAFAPSAAERQVLRSALGGSSNTSLERLPSLGDVGRISISHPGVSGSNDIPIISRALPSWLLLPQNYQVNFRPWDDEEEERTS